MVKTSLFSLIVQFIKSQFHSWLLSKIKFIDLITLLIYTLRYLYHCIVTNTVLLDQSLKSSLKITLSERITNEFFSPCGKRIRYQRHVISIKWRKNDETKHLITYQLPFSRFWKTALCINSSISIGPYSKSHSVFTRNYFDGLSSPIPFNQCYPANIVVVITYLNSLF